MKRPLTLVLTPLLLLAAAAGFAWFLFGDGDVPGPGARMPATGGAEPGEARGAAAGPAAEAAGGAVAEDGTGLRRDEVLADLPSGPTWTLQCWDREPGVPAAGVEVFVLNGYERPGPPDIFAPHWSDLAVEHGELLQTDAAGQVELPPIEESMVVAARGPGTWGFRRWGREHSDDEVLVLRPDEAVTVRVVDEGGQGVAGVPVALLQTIPQRHQPEQLLGQLQNLERQQQRVRQFMEQNPQLRERFAPRIARLDQQMAEASKKMAVVDAAKREAGYPPDWTEPFQVGRPQLQARRRSDRDGYAVFRHFQLERQGRAEWWEAQFVDRFEVGLHLPMQQSVARSFVGVPDRDEVFELRMPSTGSVALRTVDVAGNPFVHPVHGELLMVDGDQRAWRRVYVRKEQGAEFIEFPHVGLGLQLGGGCRLDDTDFRWKLEPFAGPVVAGERVEVDVVVAPGVPMLRGRVLAPSGAPLAEAELTFLITSAAGRLEGEEVVLDDAGGFHLPYRIRGGHRPPFRLEVRHDRRRPYGGLVRDLDELAGSGITEVGDLQIGEFPRIASGVVVDDRGEPVEGATLQLRQRLETGEGARARSRWVDVAFNSTESQAGGRFELSGLLEQGAEYLLRADSPEHFAASTREVGSPEPITLVLLRRSRLLGRVLLPDWLPRREIEVKLTPQDDPERVRNDQLRDYQGSTYVFFDNVRPGRYHLALRVRAFPDPFFEVRDLEILPGQMGLHPQLTDVDLGALLFRFEVEAVDGDGERFQPDRPLLAQVTRPDGRSGFVGFPWRGGRVEVLSARPQLEVVPLASRAVAPRTVLGTGTSRIRFEEIPPVQLRLPGMRALVGEAPVTVLVAPERNAQGPLPQRLEVWDQASRRIAGWFARSRMGRGTLNQDDVTRVRLPVSGRYRVSVRLGPPRDGTDGLVQLGSLDVRLIPGGDMPDFTLQVPVAEVQQALLALRSGG